MLKKNLPYVYSSLFLVIFVSIVLVLISQLNPVHGEQSYYTPLIEMISSESMSGMHGMSNMSGMHGMSGMSNMSGMHGMSGMSNMSGMHGMSGMSNMSGMMHGMSNTLEISSNEKISFFLEWMTVLIAGLIGIPFAWVIISQRKKKLR